MNAVPPSDRPGSGRPTLSNPRYAKAPLKLFFESLVLEVIGSLDADRSSRIEAMELPRVLGVPGPTWQEAVRQSLHLSETIDVAILDLWYRNAEHAESIGVVYDPVAYSQDFCDQFLAEGSQVDVWPGEALELAKARIAARHSGSDA